MSGEVRGKLLAVGAGFVALVVCLSIGLPKWPTVGTAVGTILLLLVALEFYWKGVNRRWIEAAAADLQQLGFETTEDEAALRAYEMETGRRRTTRRFAECMFFAFGQIDGRPAMVYFSPRDPYAGKYEAKPDQAMAHVVVWSQHLPTFRVGSPPSLVFLPMERGFKATSGFADPRLESSRYVYAGAAVDVERVLPAALLLDSPRHENWTLRDDKLACTWNKRVSPDDIREMISRIRLAARGLPPAPDEPTAECDDGSNLAR